MQVTRNLPYLLFYAIPYRKNENLYASCDNSEKLHIRGKHQG